MWSIMAFIVIGMVAGWLASFIVRRDRHPSDWGVLFLVGLAGSFAGGIVVNLLIGQGFTLQPGGLISSVAFACLFLWILTAVQRRSAPQQAAAAHKSGSSAHRQPKGGAKHRKH
jgi:uncharacterized membrane protein YeaQ/YmgE (transglycosylase-associated protein family)